MPTQNPRLTITLSPPLDAAIRRLSELTGQSKSALIVELLAQARPVLERMSEVITVAQAATAEAKARMAANLDEAQTKLESHLGVVQDLWEQQTMDLLGEAEQVSRRQAKGAGGTRRPTAAARGRTAGAAKAIPGSVARGVRPPPVTRGSGTSVSTPKKPGKTAAKPTGTRAGRENG